MINSTSQGCQHSAERGQNQACPIPIFPELMARQNRINDKQALILLIFIPKKST